MKKKLPIKSLHCKERTKVWRSVRLAFVVMLMFGLTARSEASPQSQRVTLNLKQGTFFQLFDEIHKQTGLRFVYNTDQLRQLGSIDVKAEDKNVGEVLTDIFHSGNLTFVMENEVVMLVPKRIAVQNPTMVTIEGAVSDSETGEPLVGCLISIPALDLWTVSDAAGRYRFPLAPTGSYQMEATYVGYEKLTYSFTLTQSVNSFALRMKALNLELNTVTVTATAENTINSSSRIERQAMEHVQPTTLRDLMQLLPGAMGTNPDFRYDHSQISLRDIINGENDTDGSQLSNRSGVGIWMNGVQLSDQASMVGPNFKTGEGQTLGQGFDTRRLSLENVESVEVIPGIASAKYGNISSGVVRVNTIKGRTPWEVRLKTDPSIKLASFSKGFGVGETGALNISGSYTTFARDIRSSRESYQRENVSLIYSNTLMHGQTRHRFSISASGYMSDNKTKPDPDEASKDNSEALNDHNVAVGVEGTLLFNKPWITNLSYTYNFNLTDIYTKIMTREGGDKFSASAMEEGEFWADRQATSFLQDFRNQSRAVGHFAQIMADVVMGKSGGVMNTVTVGGDFRSNGNVGRGAYFVPHYLEGGPTDINAYRPENFRPQPFDKIPFVNVVSFFAEDVFYLPIAGNRQSLTIEPGVRVDMILNDVMRNRTAVDPRLNVRYALVQNGNGIVRGLSLRGGYGRQTRLPNTIDMYRFDTYTDEDISFDWTDPNDPTNRHGTKHTLIRRGVDEINRDLKLQYSNKFEVGVDFDIAGIKGKVTYWNEKLRNGYDNSSGASLEMLSYRSYTDLEAQYHPTRPVYMPDPREDRPSDMVLSIDGVPLDYVVKNQISRVEKRGNAYRHDKWGVEGTLMFPRINPLQTSVMLSGAYIHLDQHDEQGIEIIETWSSAQPRLGEMNPYIASYLGGRSYFQGNGRKQFVTNAQFITNIPSLRLVATITLQAVWVDKLRFIPIEGLYHLGENGERIYGDYSGGWDGTPLYKDPAYYYEYNPQTKQFDRNVFTPDLYDQRAATVNDPLLIGDFMKDYQYSTTMGANFNERSYKPYFMANIRISKEIGRRATVSLNVNNFTDSHPRMSNKQNYSHTYMNTPIYFSGEIRLKF